MPGSNLKIWEISQVLKGSKMHTIMSSFPERVTGPLAREAAKLEPRMTNNSDQFEAVGEKWCTRYEDDPVPIKLSCPDVMCGYYTLADSQRMIDADMARRRKKFALRKLMLETESRIPREGMD